MRTCSQELPASSKPLTSEEWLRPPVPCGRDAPALLPTRRLLARQGPGAAGAGLGVRVVLRARAGVCVRSPRAEPGRRDPAACRPPGVPPPCSRVPAAPHLALATGRPQPLSPARRPLPPLKVSSEQAPSRRAAQGDGFLKLCLGGVAPLLSPLSRRPPPHPSRR